MVAGKETEPAVGALAGLPVVLAHGIVGPPRIRVRGIAPAEPPPPHLIIRVGPARPLRKRGRVKLHHVLLESPKLQLKAYLILISNPYEQLLTAAGQIELGEA